MNISDIFIFLLCGVGSISIAFIAFMPRPKHTKDDSYSHPDTLAWIAKQWDVK